MDASQPAEDRPPFPNSALRPEGNDGVKAFRSVGRMAIDLAQGEAANLTAYLNRLAIGDQPWTLTQVNTLLFLRGTRRLARARAPRVVR